MDACCFRKASPTPTFRTVRVVHLDGFVEDFEPPTTVNRVIGIFQKYFVTTPIRIMQFGLVPLKLDTQLESGRIYFLLPNSILRFNESSDNLICLTKKLTQIAKTHRPVTKPPSNSARRSDTKPAPSATLSIPKTIPSASPSMTNLQAPSPNNGSMAKPPPSPNRSKNKPPSSASSQGKRSSKISLTKKLSNIAKNHSASQQDKGSSENSGSCSNVENNNKNNNLSARRRAFAWKPLLSTVREISFNRRESDLRDN